MDKLGVEADGRWCVAGIDLHYLVDGNEKHNTLGFKAYRLDTLLWVLPDWVIFNINLTVEQRKFQSKHADLFSQLKSNKGSKAIAAAVQLIKLLDENNLLETRK